MPEPKLNKIDEAEHPLQPKITQIQVVIMQTQQKDLAGKVHANVMTLPFGLGEDSKPYVWDPKSKQWLIV